MRSLVFLYRLISDLSYHDGFSKGYIHFWDHISGCLRSHISGDIHDHSTHLDIVNCSYGQMSHNKLWIQTMKIVNAFYHFKNIPKDTQEYEKYGLIEKVLNTPIPCMSYKATNDGRT